MRTLQLQVRMPVAEEERAAACPAEADSLRAAAAAAAAGAAGAAELQELRQRAEEQARTIQGQREGIGALEVPDASLWQKSPANLPGRWHAMDAS